MVRKGFKSSGDKHIGIQLNYTHFIRSLEKRACDGIGKARGVKKQA